MMATEKRLIEIIECLEHCADNTDCERCSRWLYHCDDHCVDDLLATAAKELRKFVDAVVLPCKIGDKVYRIDKGNYHSNWKPFVQELTVTEISWKKEKYGDKDLGFAIIADGIRYKFTSIGKSVFLTREEAEAKMDGERKDNG